MKKLIPTLIGFSIIVGSYSNVSPISREAAYWGTAVATSVAAASSVVLAKVKKFDLTSSVFFVGGVTSVMALCSRIIFFNMTPDARIRRAAKILENIEWDPLFNISMSYYDDPQMLIHRVYEEYFDSILPLIDAFDQLVYIRSLLSDARMLLDAAKNEGIEYRFVDSYCKYCENIDEYRKFIDNALVAIKQDPRWIESLNANVIQEAHEIQERIARAAEYNFPVYWASS